MIEFMMKV